MGVGAERLLGQALAGIRDPRQQMMQPDPDDDDQDQGEPDRFHQHGTKRLRKHLGQGLGGRIEHRGSPAQCQS